MSDTKPTQVGSLAQAALEALQYLLGNDLRSDDVHDDDCPTCNAIRTIKSALEVVPAERTSDWKAMDRVEEAAEAAFKILSPGLPYTPEDAFWYRQVVHAVLERCSPAASASDIERAFTDVCDELGCKYDNEAALEAIDALKRRSQPETVDLTNHHNALLCPYCNPKGLKLEEPRG